MPTLMLLRLLACLLALGGARRPTSTPTPFPRKPPGVAAAIDAWREAALLATP